MNMPLEPEAAYWPFSR
jgi:hypothetical protein